MSYKALFYWLTVADGFKSALDTFSNIFTWLFVLSGIAMVILIIMKSTVISNRCTKNEEEDKLDPEVRSVTKALNYIRGIFYTSLSLSLVLWLAWAATPTKKDALIIVAGGATMDFLTTDSSAKQLPKELSGFLVTEIKNMAAEAKVDMGIKENKQKIMDEAKQLTSEQLLDKINTDTTFRNIILDKK